MLALEEKARTVALFRPELLLNGKSQEIIGKLEDAYLEVKAKKQVYLTKVDAESFFHYLPPEQRAASVEAFTQGSCEVVVLEHLDGDAIDRTAALVEELKPAYGEDSIYCSESCWESTRDLEFFFPHLDAMPVERTLLLIKPDGLAKGQFDGQTLEQLVEGEVAGAGLFVVGKQRMVLGEAAAAVLCEELKGTPDYKGAHGILLADPGVIAMCVEGAGAVGKCLLLCGPTNAGVAKARAPTTIRACWGTDSTSNAVHASSSMAAAEKELKALFPPGSLHLQRTLCMVKPHAMADLLQIHMEVEQAGFTILKEKHTTLSEDRAKEFFRDHKERPTFNAMVKEACAGKCCLMVLCRLEAVTVWQQLMGPEVVKDAKAYRPRSVRARYGRDGQKNAVHGSESAKSAAWEVRFFFPELGADPIPGDDEVRDFLFRKSAGASMDLKTLSSADGMDHALDPTLQQLISSGLLALCQVRPKGLGAITWFKDWLIQNNPSAASHSAAQNPPFQPPERTKRFVEYGVNPDGMPFSVEAPAPTKQKKVVDVDVSEETEEHRVADFSTPPYVIFVAGVPGASMTAHCTRLCEEFNFVHLDATQMMKHEVAAASRLGTEIMKHMQKKEPVPDSVTLQLFKKAMTKSQDTNRFLLNGYPRTLEQAKRFEQEIAAAAFVLYLEGAAEDTKAPEQVLQVVKYYSPIGRVRQVSADQQPDAAYAEMRRYFLCRLLYLMGPPGAPTAKVAARLEEKYGYSSIDLTALLQSYANSEEKEAAKVKQAFAKGKPIDASIACPLILAEVYRGLAMGVHNFVISDFPQSLKQAEFLEYRVPCTSKPLLLDFTRADTHDLASTISTGAGVEMRTGTFFGAEMQAVIASLPHLVRIPCSLADIDSVHGGRGPSTAAGLEQQLVDDTWAKVCEKVTPGVTLVLGLPCSGTDVLVPMLAGRTPNTYAVDCNQLLDKEMERKTEVGLQMHNMLARGQVVPLSTTLELLKDVVNLTCSDSIVIENCPMYVDQIEYLTKEFRIDKVFSIDGNEKAAQAWKDKYLSTCKGDDAEKNGRAFLERKQRLAQILRHFSRLGKLDRLEVAETPKKETLSALVDQATLPQFVLVTGLSSAITPKLAEMIASHLSAGPVLKLEGKQEGTAEVLSKLKRHVESGSYPLLVLDRYLTNDEVAMDFLSSFGTPKLVINVSCEPEFIEEEFKAAHEDMEEEQVAAALMAQRTAHEAALKILEERCPSALVTLDRAKTKAPPEDPVRAAKEMCELVRPRLLPKAYVVVAPCGEAGFSGLVADSICSSARTGSRPAKLTVVDASKLFKPGGHHPAIEEALHRAAFMGQAPDCLPAKLWVELFSEAFGTSANPMGPFLITNFPTLSSVTSGPTIRDQFDMLESIAVLGGILHVRLSEEAFVAVCSDSAAEWEAQRGLDAKVQDQILQQFDKDRIRDSVVDSIPEGAEMKVVNKVCAEFLGFLEKTE